MKVHTSKSAFETRNASSASGIRVKMASMENQIQVQKRMNDLKGVIAYLDGMTSEQFSAFLLKTGIITQNGDLAPHYQTKKKSRKKSSINKKTV